MLNLTSGVCVCVCPVRDGRHVQGVFLALSQMKYAPTEQTVITATLNFI